MDAGLVTGGEPWGGWGWGGMEQGKLTPQKFHIDTKLYTINLGQL